MLPSNGRRTIERRNYHLSFAEFSSLIRFLRDRYDPKWLVAVMVQGFMGLRASEMLALNLSDFSPDFKKLGFRAAKTNEIIRDEPVPEVVRQAIVGYLRDNLHRCKNGYLFPGRRRAFLSTEAYGVYWSKWRHAIGGSFMERYELETGRFRYRIGSHSLRRLHRTLLADAHPEDLFRIAKVCHYKDASTFMRYVNEFKMIEEREKLLIPVMDEAGRRALMLSRDQATLGEF